jgi:hypothetical protein
LHKCNLYRYTKAPPPAKRARVTRGPEDAPAGTRVIDKDDGSVESFERAALGALLWRRPEVGLSLPLPGVTRLVAWTPYWLSSTGVFDHTPY